MNQKPKRYSVGYTDKLNNKREFCTYAYDAYHARISAIEMVQDIHTRPNSINYILEEGKDDW